MSEPRTDAVPGDRPESELATLRKRVADLEEKAKRYDAALQALANFSLVEDRHPTHRDEEYQKNPDNTKYDVLEALLKPGTSDIPAGVYRAIYMLGTYCFDLSRRFAFVNASVTKALPRGVRPDGELRDAMDKDDDELHEPQGDRWQERARISARQLKKWHTKAHELVVQHSRRSS